MRTLCTPRCLARACCAANSCRGLAGRGANNRRPCLIHVALRAGSVRKCVRPPKIYSPNTVSPRLGLPGELASAFSKAFATSIESRRGADGRVPVPFVDTARGHAPSPHSPIFQIQSRFPSHTTSPGSRLSPTARGLSIADWKKFANVMSIRATLRNEGWATHNPGEIRIGIVQSPHELRATVCRDRGRWPATNQGQANSLSEVTT
jgi:hypothetical protein